MRVSVRVADIVYDAAGEMVPDFWGGCVAEKALEETCWWGCGGEAGGCCCGLLGDVKD